MTHAKKLLALVMALAMSLSVMAMTASAYSAEAHAHDEACYADEIMPRRPDVDCPICHTKASYEERWINSGTQKQYRLVCPNNRSHFDSGWINLP